jgi:hypothetical protein
MEQAQRAEAIAKYRQKLLEHKRFEAKLKSRMYGATRFTYTHLSIEIFLFF